jgi:hypothetical protein
VHHLDAVNIVQCDVGCALIDFDINIGLMGRAAPGVECERQHHHNGQQQLLCSSAAAIFNLPLAVHIVRIRAHAPIVVFSVERNNSSCECICFEILSDIFSM